MATASRAMRRPTKTSARSEARSAHWASSTEISSGCASARPAIKRLRPCWTAWGSAPSAGASAGSKIGAAGAAAPSSSSAGGVPVENSDSNSWRTTPYGKSRSYSPPRARSTSMSQSAPRPAAASSRVVLPAPASPSTVSRRPAPAAAEPRTRSISASSSSLSINAIAATVSAQADPTPRRSSGRYAVHPLQLNADRTRPSRPIAAGRSLPLPSVRDGSIRRIRAGRAGPSARRPRARR